MKKVLIFLIYTIAPIFSNAQSPIEGYQIGYWYDINKNLIDGYYDIEYKPEEYLSLSYTVGDQLTPGYYYNLEGEKIDGYLKYFMYGSSLQFRSTKDGDQKSIKPSECKGYVIGKDSFTVISNFDIQRDLISQGKTDPAFVEVIDQFDNLVFYKHIYTGIQNSTVTYMVRDTTNTDYISFPKTKSKFIKTATPYFKDFDILAEGIKLEKFTEENILTLIKMLKYKKCFDSNRKIFFDSNWGEESDSTNHFYYALVNSIKDTIINVTYYTSGGHKVYEGDFTSFYPHKKRGSVSFFFPNGELRKKTKTSNKTTFGTIYHHNGKARLNYKIFDKGIKYDQIYSTNGVSLFDVKGNALETFYDSIQSRLVYTEYKAFELVSSYYKDLSGRKVYLCTDKNTSIKGFKSMKTTFSNLFEYPEESLKKGNQGTALISCVIEPSGIVSEMKVIKGIDNSADEAILKFLSKMKSKPMWKSGKLDGEKVTQQIIIPISLKIIGFSWYRNNTGNYWMYYNPQQMMMAPIPTKYIPTGPPTKF